MRLFTPYTQKNLRVNPIKPNSSDAALFPNSTFTLGPYICRHYGYRFEQIPGDHFAL